MRQASRETFLKKTLRSSATLVKWRCMAMHTCQIGPTVSHSPLGAARGNVLRWVIFLPSFPPFPRAWFFFIKNPGLRSYGLVYIPISRQSIFQNQCPENKLIKKKVVSSKVWENWRVTGRYMYSSELPSLPTNHHNIKSILI